MKDYLIKYSPYSFIALAISFIVTVSAKILGNDWMTNTAKAVRVITDKQGRERVLFYAAASFWFILTVALMGWVVQ